MKSVHRTSPNTHNIRRKTATRIWEIKTDLQLRRSFRERTVQTMADRLKKSMRSMWAKEKKLRKWPSQIKDLSLKATKNLLSPNKFLIRSAKSKGSKTKTIQYKVEWELASLERGIPRSRGRPFWSKSTRMEEGLHMKIFATICGADDLNGFMNWYENDGRMENIRYQNSEERCTRFRPFRNLLC